MCFGYVKRRVAGVFRSRSLGSFGHLNGGMEIAVAVRKYAEHIHHDDGFPERTTDIRGRW